MARTEQSGFSLVEILLALALVSLAVGAFAGAILYTQGLALASQPRQIARTSAQECLEVARWLRDVDGFDALTDGAHGLMMTDGRWQLDGTEDVTASHTRSLLIEPYDPDIKQATCAVSWPDRGGTASVSMMTLLAR